MHLTEKKKSLLVLYNSYYYFLKCMYRVITSNKCYQIKHLKHKIVIYIIHQNRLTVFKALGKGKLVSDNTKHYSKHIEFR